MIRLTIFTFLLAGFQSIGQTEIYNEDFQSGMPAGYTLVDNDLFAPHVDASEYTDAWIIASDPDNTSDSVASSTSYFTPVGQADRWLITPAITLGSFGNVVYWEGKSHDASFPDDYFVLVSGTDTQLSSFTDTLDIVYQESEDWMQHNANISELGYNSQDIHLAFVIRTDDGYKLYLDDIRVEMEDPVSVNELETISTYISPNPSSETIQINGIEEVNNVKVISLDGKIILESKQKTINISSLETGNYIVQVESPSGIARTKLMKN